MILCDTAPAATPAVTAKTNAVSASLLRLICYVSALRVMRAQTGACGPDEVWNEVVAVVCNMPGR